MDQATRFDYIFRVKFSSGYERCVQSYARNGRRNRKGYARHEDVKKEKENLDIEHRR